MFTKNYENCSCFTQFFKNNKKWFVRRLKKIKLLILLISFAYRNSQINVAPKRLWLLGYVWLFGFWLFGGSTVTLNIFNKVQKKFNLSSTWFWFFFLFIFQFSHGLFKTKLFLKPLKLNLFRKIPLSLKAINFLNLKSLDCLLF